MISATGSTVSTGVPGLITTPAATPSSRISAQRVVDVRRRLRVDGDHVGARLGERLDLALGPLDHEVAVEDPAAAVHELPDRGDDQRPDRDRRDEVAVHHVDVDHARAGVHHQVVTCSASREKSHGEERGGDLPRRDRAGSLALLEGAARLGAVGEGEELRDRGPRRAPSPSGARTTRAAAGRRDADLADRARRAARARPRPATAARRRGRAAPPP